MDRGRNIVDIGARAPIPASRVGGTSERRDGERARQAPSPENQLHNYLEHDRVPKGVLHSKAKTRQPITPSTKRRVLDVPNDGNQCATSKAGGQMCASG